MSKNKIVMCVIGGVAGVLVLIIGWFVYSEFEAQETKRADLQTQQSAISRNAWADPKAAKAHEGNKKAIDGWAGDAFKMVSGMAGRNPHREAPAAFRQRMFKKQRELMKLPKGKETKIIKDTFYFGERFRSYIDSNTAAIPAERDVPALQREWDDVIHFTEILLRSGATELTAVSVLNQPKPVEEKKPRRGGRGSSRSAETVNPYPSTEKNYEFTFLARPEALVKVMNAIASDKDRFMAVDSLSFEHADDPLKKILGEGDKEKKESAGGRRRGRRKSGGLLDAGDENEDDAVRKGLVTNPETAAPFTVVMKVSTIVFAKTADAKAKGGRK